MGFEASRDLVYLGKASQSRTARILMAGCVRAIRPPLQDFVGGGEGEPVRLPEDLADHVNRFNVSVRNSFY